MNFKPTLWKSIISVFVLIIVDIALSSQVMVFDAPNYWYSHIFEPMIITISFVIAIVVYVVWSLIQKKK